MKRLLEASQNGEIITLYFFDGPTVQVELLNIKDLKMDFDEFVTLLQQAKTDLDSLAKIKELTVSSQVKKKLESINGYIFNQETKTIRKEGSNEVIYLPSILFERLLSNDEAVFKFFEKLMENPDKRVFDNLYKFLIASNIVIDNEGDLLTYKKVRSDYFDIYTGTTYCYKPGSTITMPRFKVDNDPNRTCSQGLHVCSKEYLSHFGDNDASQAKVVICKVNPKNVVSIPIDYNFQKMRVSELEVISEVPLTFELDHLPERTYSNYEEFLTDLKNTSTTILKSYSLSKEDLEDVSLTFDKFITYIKENIKEWIDTGCEVEESFEEVLYSMEEEFSLDPSILNHLVLNTFPKEVSNIDTFDKYVQCYYSNSCILP